MSTPNFYEISTDATEAFTAWATAVQSANRALISESVALGTAALTAATSQMSSFSSPEKFWRAWAENKKS